MNWADERYVRLYTRDTVDWLALSWDAQSLLMQLLRKVDRAGILPLGKRGRASVALVVGRSDMADRIVAALGELEADGCVVINDGRLVFRNFIEAQECVHSDAARKRAQRERDRDKAVAGGFKGSLAGADIVAALGRSVSSGHEESQPVTPAVTAGHTASQAVTDGHSVPCRAEPAVPCRTSQEAPQKNLLLGSGGQTETAQVPAPSVRPVTERVSKGPTQSNPRHTPLKARLLEAYRQETGQEYPTITGAEAKAISTLCASPRTDEQLEALWRLSIRTAPAWPGTADLRALPGRLSDLEALAAARPKRPATLTAGATATAGACAICGASSIGQFWGQPLCGSHGGEFHADPQHPTTEAEAARWVETRRGETAA